MNSADIRAEFRSSANGPAVPRVSQGRSPGTPAPTRDHRIDLIRGLALAMIFINHMPGNWLENWTSRNLGFSDAAEVFVLLAGYAAAFAFSPYLKANDHRGAALKAARRVGVLYAAHLATTLSAIALFSSVMAAWGPSDTRDLIGIAPILDDPVGHMIAILLGGFQLSYFNILPMYVVLLALLPTMLWLAAKDLRLLAAASLATYLLTNMGGVMLPRSSNGDSWFFNPLAWQLVFVVGLVLGLRRSIGNQLVAYRWSCYLLAAGYLIFAAVWKLGQFGGDLETAILPAWMGSLQKSNLPLTRLFHVLALAYVVCHSPVWRWLSLLPKDFVLTQMGRHSLPVFMAGSLLSMAGWIVLKETQGGPVIDATVAAVGLVVMAALALWIEQHARAPRLWPEGRSQTGLVHAGLVTISPAQQAA